MATKRPAKISKKKKKLDDKICPITGKGMAPVRVVRSNGPSGMYWMVVDDFDGTNQSLERLIPTR